MQPQATARYVLPIVVVVGLAACGGGGGESSPPAIPTVTLTASAADVRTNGSVTLTWSSSNATSCSASGGMNWSGAVSTSGSQSLTVGTTAAYSLSCSGAGGASSASVTVTAWAQPTASISSSDSEILSGNPVTIQWSSTNARSCKGTAGLSEAINTSGSLTTPNLTASSTYSLECSNPAWPVATGSVAVSVSTTYKLLVTAKYQKPGASTRLNSDGFLVPGFDAPVTNVIPFVWIELLRSDGTSVAGAYANSSGEVQFSGLDPSASYTPAIQSKTRQNGFDLWVVNNKSPIDKTKDTVRTRYAPYQDRAASYQADKKKVNQATELLATLGWDATAQKLDDAKRVSAPYAVLKDLNEIEALARKASAATTDSPALTVLWTPTNKGGSTSFTDDFDGGLTDGSGGYFSTGYRKIDSSGKTTGSFAEDNIIYISGDQAFEMMEFGGFVTVHEAWHFIQSFRFRDDAVGGQHGRQDYQDLRLVFSEGFASAIPMLIEKTSTLSRYSPVSGKVIVSQLDFSKDIRNSPKGWFQELIVGRLVWAAYNPTGEIKLSAEKILEPLFSSEWASGKWPTNLWAYGKILKERNPSLASALDAVGASLNVTLAGNDEWGSVETILGNRTQSQTFPIFTELSVGSTKTVCSVGKSEEFNKLSNWRFLRIRGDTTGRTLRVTGPTNTVPIITLGLFSKNAASNIPGTAVNGSPWRAKGQNVVSLSGIFPTNGEAWATVGECKVTLSPDPAFTKDNCSATSYTPPEEQCWTVSWQ